MMKRTVTLIAAALTSAAITTQSASAAAYNDPGIRTAEALFTANDAQVVQAGFKHHRSHGFKHRGYKVKKFKRHGHGVKKVKKYHGHAPASKKHHKIKKFEKALILKKLLD